MSAELERGNFYSEVTIGDIRMFAAPREGEGVQNNSFFVLLSVAHKNTWRTMYEIRWDPLNRTPGARRSQWYPGSGVVKGGSGLYDTAVLSNPLRVGMDLNLRPLGLTTTTGQDLAPAGEIARILFDTSVEPWAQDDRRIPQAMLSHLRGNPG